MMNQKLIIWLAIMMMILASCQSDRSEQRALEKKIVCIELIRGIAQERGEKTGYVHPDMIRIILQEYEDGR